MSIASRLNSVRLVFRFEQNKMLGAPVQSHLSGDETTNRSVNMVLLCAFSEHIQMKLEFALMFLC